MFRFIESICVQDGNLKLLELHQARVNRTFLRHFNQKKPLNLREVIQNIPTRGKHKCRVEYSLNDFEIEFVAYNNPIIGSLQVVHDNEVLYDFKSLERSRLTRLFDQRESADDIIIIKKGKVTDSYFANLAFFDGANWWTSDSPLLQGVKREWLLNHGFLNAKQILETDINSFQKVSLINAMLDLGEVCVPLKV